MHPVDLSPVGREAQTQRPFDLFLIFVGANIVATTLQVGASLPTTLSLPIALGVIGVGAVGGAALTAVLAPIGTRLRVPSIVASRAPLGFSGAHLLALLLFLTNFVWIALNNAIAASICVRLTGVGTEDAWAAALGLAATLIVLGGPRFAALVDRVAVPLLLVAGGVFTVAIVRAPAPACPTGPVPFGDVVRGLDVVAGYQVSWLLMFADYPRFVRSARAAGVAVFLGLALTALWFMPLGLVASALARSADPGEMVYALQSRLVGRNAAGPGRAHHELREHLHVGARVQEPAPLGRRRHRRVDHRRHRIGPRPAVDGPGSIGSPGSPWCSGALLVPDRRHPPGTLLRPAHAGARPRPLRRAGALRGAARVVGCGGCRMGDRGGRLPRRRRHRRGGPLPGGLHHRVHAARQGAKGHVDVGLLTLHASGADLPSHRTR